VLVITKTYAIPGTTNGRSNSVQHSNIRFFGTPGPTTLDKGSLSLGRSLDVPRISRYDVDTETPRPEKLVVDFDTTVNSSPTDISGQGNHGTLVGATYSAADKAFDFSATNNVIYAPSLSPTMTGDIICSMSCWFKVDNSTTRQTIMWIGSDAASGDFIDIRVKGGHIGLSMGFDPDTNMLGIKTGSILESNRWYHVVGVKSGTGAINSTTTNTMLQLYLDGVRLNTTDGGLTEAGGLNIPTDHNFLVVGAANETGSVLRMAGQISNPKVYNVALEASEVQKLYRLGRTGRSMVISDTAVGIGKVPEAQLDVRGNINSEGIMTNKNYMFFATGPPSAMLQAGVAAGNDLVANFSRIEFILGSGFDTSTKTYTIPCSGYWEFSYCLLARNVATGVHWVMGRWLINGALYDNRSFVYFTGQGGGSQESNLIGKIIGYYTAGTTISVRISQNSDGTDVYMSSNYSHFFGKLLH